MAAPNRLNNRHQHKLNVYGDEHREEFRGKTYSEIAEMATAALGFPITMANIRGLVKAMEIDLEPKPTLEAEPDLFLASLVARVEELEAQLAKLKSLHTLEPRMQAFSTQIAGNVESLTKRVNSNEILVERVAARVLGRSN